MHTNLAVPKGEMEGQSLTTQFQEMLDAEDEEGKKVVKLISEFGPQISPKNVIQNYRMRGFQNVTQGNSEQ